MILVIGATGNVGKEVVSQLVKNGEQVRALSRNISRLNLSSPLLEGVQGDLTDKESLLIALKDVKKVFLVLRGQGAAEVVQAAVTQGVEHIVFLSSSSVVDAEAKNHFNAKRHLEVEEMIATAGLNWTFVRPGSFAVNSLQWAASIKQHNAVQLPYPEAHLASIHEADIAAVSVAALTQENMIGKSFILSGPASLTQKQMVATISTVLGKPILFDEVTPDQYRENMSQHMPAHYVDVLLRHWAAANGVPDKVTNTVEEVTGRPAKTYAQWVEDHKADFA